MDGGWEDIFGTDTSFTLDDAIDITWDNYRQDFRRFWGLESAGPPNWLPHEDWLAVKREFGMGEQAARLALLLVAPKGVGSGHLESLKQIRQRAEEFERLLRETKSAAIESGNPELAKVMAEFDTPDTLNDPRTRLGIFENAIQLSLGGDLIPSLGTASKRAQRLLESVVKVNNQRVAEYLSRVAKCYCLDLNTEMAVMSRAVIDAALEDFMPNEDVERLVGPSQRGQIGLAARINAAVASGLIAPEVISLMREVKQNGDDAAHALPGMAPSCEIQLDTLTRALAGITEK